jgi:hypothetical protein
MKRNEKTMTVNKRRQKQINSIYFDEAKAIL